MRLDKVDGTPASFEGAPTTDEQALELLDYSDWLVKSSAQGLYKCKRAMGETVLDALVYTWKAVVGPIRHEDPPC